jgi:hypothetical protein
MFECGRLRRGGRRWSRRCGHMQSCRRSVPARIRLLRRHLHRRDVRGGGDRGRRSQRQRPQRLFGPGGRMFHLTRVLQRPVRARDRRGRRRPMPRCVPRKRRDLRVGARLLFARMLRRRVQRSALHDCRRSLPGERRMLLRSMRPVDAAVRRRPRQLDLPPDRRRLRKRPAVGLLRRDEGRRPLRSRRTLRIAARRLPRAEGHVRCGRRLLLEALRYGKPHLHDAVHRGLRRVRDGIRLLHVELHQRAVRRSAFARRGHDRRGHDRRRRADRNGARVQPDRDRVHGRRCVLHQSLSRGVLRPSAGVSPGQPAPRAASMARMRIAVSSGVPTVIRNASRSRGTSK